MIAAIYARKSTSQDGVVDEAKSVKRQVEHATTYAASQGWTVDDRFIFEDDGISGAEFANRPGFLRLLNALKPKAPFHVLIVSELSRLGREQLETGFALKQIAQAGVRIFSFFERREIPLDSPTNRFLVNAVSFASEMEREQARQRALDVSFGKARAGYVTGGKVFGYENIRVNGHVERRILEPEAEIVRAIYDFAAEGHGSRHIAHMLNERHVPCPRAQQGRPSGWDQGTIRAVLGRPLYRGIIEYGATRKRDAWGRKKITARPATDLVRVSAPHLRIIAPEVAVDVDMIRRDRRQRYLRSNDGRLLGRPTLGKFLLSGMLKCHCGANYELQQAHGWRKGGYVCSAARRKGRAVCDNTRTFPREETEHAILTVIEGVVLSPAYIETVLDRIFVPDDGDRSALEAERAELERQLANLTEAIKLGGNLKRLVDEMEAVQQRLLMVQRYLEPKEAANRAEVRAALEQRVDDWKTILRQHPIQARQILHHLLDGPIQIQPAAGFQIDPGDDRGLENITPDDFRLTEGEFREVANSMRHIAGMMVWTAATKPIGLLQGLPGSERLASPSIPSWNQIMAWLHDMAVLRESGIAAA